MKITSIRTRLTLWNIGIFALVLSGFLLVAQFAVRRYLLADLDRRLDSMADRQVWMINHVPNFNRPPRQEGDDSQRRRAGNRPLRLVRIFDLQGHSLVLSGGGSPPVEPPWDLSAYTKAAVGISNVTTVQGGETPLRLLSRPLVENGRQIGVLQVAVSYAEVQALLNSLTEILLLLIPCALAVAGIAGLVLTNSVLRPVGHIITAADAIHHEDLSKRLPVIGGDEFALLATTMNSMLERLEGAYTQLQQSIEKERRFTADASHELRTPLTAIKANTSLALRGERTPAQYREALQAIHQAGEMMHRLVQDLLLLARADSGQLLFQCQQIDLQALISTAITMTEHGEAHARVQVSITPGMGIICGDEHHLQRVLINLLENALRHTPEDGLVTLTACEEQERVILTIADTGEGIAPVHLPHLGERFYRIDAARARRHGGTGLGLSICKSIIQAHQGTMTIESTEGKGTSVRIALPRRVLNIEA